MRKDAAGGWCIYAETVAFLDLLSWTLKNASNLAGKAIVAIIEAGRCVAWRFEEISHAGRLARLPLPFLGNTVARGRLYLCSYLVMFESRRLKT